MKKIDFQTFIGKVILYSNGLLFVLTLFFLVTESIMPAEFAEIMKFLVPIQALYMTAIVKFMMDNKYVKIKEEVEEPKILTPFYVKITKGIVFFHVVGVLSAILLKGVGLIQMTLFSSLIAIIETFFGVYIGSIFLDLFKTEEPKS